MSVSLETLLTSPAFFGLTTATPVQRAKCRLVSGEPLGALASHPDVIAMLNSEASLPTDAPREVLDVSASRVGKSLFGAALIVHASQSIDVSSVSLGDIIRFHVAALKLDGTRAVMTHLVNHLVAKPALRALLIGKPDEATTTGVRLRHPSGREIEVEPVPIDRAGGSALSVYSAGALVDEYPRMVGADDGVKNADHFRDAVLGRMLPGAQFFATGSPWQPFGPAFDAVTKHWGKPTSDLVVLRTTGQAANPSWWTPARCAELERRNPIAYRTDCLAEFADGEASVFPTASIEAAFRATPALVIDAGDPVIVLDASAGRHDSWTYAVVQWVTPHPGHEFLKGDHIDERTGELLARDAYEIRTPDGERVANPEYSQSRPMLVFLEVGGWDGAFGQRLAADELVNEVARVARRCGAREVHADQFENYALASMFQRHSLRYHVHHWTAASKTTGVDRARSLLVAGQIVFPAHDRLRRELQRFRQRATAGGFSYVVPGQGHGDYASLLVTAAMADAGGFLSSSPAHRSRERIDWDSSDIFSQ